MPEIELEPRRCAQCGRLSWAGVSVCPDCGFPAFALFRPDLTAWVCRVNRRSVSPALDPTADEQPGAFFATIHNFANSEPNDIRFRFGWSTNEDVKIVPDPDGPLCLRFLERPIPEATIRIPALRIHSL
jgi:ribosomal protein L37E